MSNDESRKRLRDELAAALQIAWDDYRASFAYVIHTEGPCDTSLAGAARAYSRAKNQAWRDYRRGIAELRRAQRREDRARAERDAQTV